MRFGRRRNRPSLNLIPDRTDATGNNLLPACWVVWNSPFSILHSATSRSCHSENVTHYVPKCIPAVSPSDILCGDRVENFSSDCWLQNHLDRFGHDIQQNNNQSIIEDIEADNSDDSPIGSQTTTESNSLSSFELDNSLEDETVNRLYIAYRHLTDIAPYTEVVEPPPYGLPDLPPSYEEAIAGDQRRDSVSTASSSSEVDFYLY